MGTGCKKWGRGKRAAPGGRAPSALPPGGTATRGQRDPLGESPSKTVGPAAMVERALFGQNGSSF